MASDTNDRMSDKIGVNCLTSLDVVTCYRTNVVPRAEPMALKLSEWGTLDVHI